MRKTTVCFSLRIKLEKSKQESCLFCALARLLPFLVLLVIRYIGHE